MPIYEYQCQECDHGLEALQKISDPMLKDCPACGEASLKKKVSAAAFRLKGSGWYETDFKTGNKKNLAGDGKKGDASGASGNASGGDTGGSSGTSGGKKTTKGGGESKSPA